MKNEIYMKQMVWRQI